MESQTVTASVFKAKCLDILDRVARHEVDRVVITKRGRVVGVLVPPAEAGAENLFGFMRGTVVVPPDVDLTDPVLEDRFEAEDGLLHV